MAGDQGEFGHVVTVVGQEGDRVHVAVPMAGFPEGFELQPGTRVLLVQTPSGPAARPLVRATRARVEREAVNRRESLGGEGARQSLQEATEVSEQPAVGRRGDEDVVFVVESEEADAPEQVVAVRLTNPDRK